LPEEEYERLEIADRHLMPEFDGDKLAIIDVKLHTKTRKVIHIEIQLLSEKSDKICYPTKNTIRAETRNAIKTAA
jgi:hypothetical protein